MYSTTLLAILVLALILGVGALVMVYFVKPKPQGMTRQKFDSLWREIEKHSRSGGVNGLKHAIIDADKLLDQVLKSRVVGQNLGGRLKNAKDIFSDKRIYNDAWEVHKLRNRLVHEVDFVLRDAVGKKAVSDYRRVFRDLGY